MMEGIVHGTRIHGTPKPAGEDVDNLLLKSSLMNTFSVVCAMRPNSSYAHFRDADVAI